MAIFTLGHSTLSKDDFIKITGGRVSTLIDIRSHPNSKWEQFKYENLVNWIPEFGLKYEWWPELGGWSESHSQYIDPMKEHGVDVQVYTKGKFPKQRIAKKTDPEEKPRWTNVGLYDYQYFMSIPEFTNGVKKLINKSEKENVAIFCCECLYWKCHRSMVSDCLHWLGIPSIHLQPKLTLHSKAIGNRIERYEPDVIESWKNAFNR